MRRDSDHSVRSTATPGSDRRLTWLVVLTVLCYAIGYPLALIGHSALGWVFVALGGPLLIATGIVVIRRVHISIDAGPG